MISHHRLLLTLAFLAGHTGLFLAPAHATAQPPAVATAPAPADTLASRLHARCRAELIDQRLVGLSAAIARADGAPLTVHLGHQDREKRLPASDATMYRWASVSKPLTAVAAMRLVAGKRLDLDADARTLVPEFPDKGHVITPRHLLTHQSGIVHYSNGPVIRTRRTYDSPHPFESVILALDTFKDSPLVSEPGEKHAYTTHGYILLGAVIERAGNAPFWHQVRDHIAQPLGLTSLQPDYPWIDIPHRAVGYVKQRDADALTSTDTDVSWKLPGGGFISTVADMARFGAGLLDDRLLDAPTRRLMWTRQPTRDGAKTDYALGWTVSVVAGRTAFLHSGSQEKTATFLIVVPEGPRGAPGLACAVMCNTQGAALGDLARDLVRLAYADAPPSPTPAERP